MNIYGVAQVQKDFANGGYYKTLSFRDVTSGSNRNYTASFGWDPVTGMGSFAKYTPSSSLSSASKTVASVLIVLLIAYMCTYLN